MNKLYILLALGLVLSMSMVMAFPAHTLVWGTVTNLAGTPQKNVTVAVICEHQSTIASSPGIVYNVRTAKTMATGMYMQPYAVQDCSVNEKVFVVAFKGNSFGFSNTIVQYISTSPYYSAKANIVLR